MTLKEFEEKLLGLSDEQKEEHEYTLKYIKDMLNMKKGLENLKLKDSLLSPEYYLQSFSEFNYILKVMWAFIQGETIERLVYENDYRYIDYPCPVWGICDSSIVRIKPKELE